MVRYRDPSTEEIIDDREMQRRFHADEVIRREFDPEHGPAVPHGSRTGTRTSPGTAGTTARRTRTPGEPRLAFTVTPTRSFETLVCRLFQDGV
jgi:hypothetical protein